MATATFDKRIVINQKDADALLGEPDKKPIGPPKTKKILSIDEIKTYITPVVEKYPIEKVILYGSYARGEATETSDVDLVVESGGKMRNTKIFTLGGELLGILPVRVDVYDILEIVNPSAMYDNIQKDGVVIYEAAR